MGATDRRPIDREPGARWAPRPEESWGARVGASRAFARTSTLASVSADHRAVSMRSPSGPFVARNASNMILAASTSSAANESASSAEIDAFAADPPPDQPEARPRPDAGIARCRGPRRAREERERAGACATTEAAASERARVCGTHNSKTRLVIRKTAAAPLSMRTPGIT